MSWNLKILISTNTTAYLVWPKQICKKIYIYNVKYFYGKLKKLYGWEKRHLCPCRSSSYFCDRLFKSYIQEKKYLKSNSSNLMQAGLSRMIIPIKLDSSTLKERGMARWGGLKSKSLVGPPRLRKGMHHHYIHWKFDLTCIVRNIISIWTTY